MGTNLRIAAPVALARPRDTHRFEAFSPKLDRRVMFYRSASLDQWVLIEANPAAIALCERPEYVHLNERKRLAGFRVRYVDRQDA